ncbi:hypothetical protein DL98DRAFT_585785 [Cadophora sp. DSE1049]|nr:hypothetical protein DL98DRAFT_585785 [Cadophora sp. DSE1049]
MNPNSRGDWDDIRRGQNMFLDDDYEDEEPEEGDEELEEEDDAASATNPYQYNKHSGNQKVDKFDKTGQSDVFLADPMNSQALVSHAFQGKFIVHLQAAKTKEEQVLKCPREATSSAFTDSGASYNQKSFADHRPSTTRSSSDVHIKPKPFSPPVSPNVQAAPKTNDRIEELRSENKRLKAQLRDVQKERLSALDDFQPCSDSDLKDAFLRLQRQVSALSRQLRSSLSKSPNIATTLSGYMLSVCPTNDIQMKYIFESFLWRQLYVECFQTPFVLVGSEAAIVYQVWCLIFSNGLGTYPKATEASERWRSITAAEMFSGMTPFKRNERVKEITQSFLSKFASLDFELHSSLAKGDHLEKLIGKGWDTAALFAQQRCRLSLTPPVTIENLSSNWVEVVEEVQYTERAVFGVSPSLLKYGTGHGQNFDTWLCIVKSKAVRVGDP